MPPIAVKRLYYLTGLWNLRMQIQILLFPQRRRFVIRVASGNGSVEDRVSTSHGHAVSAALLSKCHPAAPAIYETAPAMYDTALVQYQSVVVALGQAIGALKSSHVEEFVAFFNVDLHAQIALAPNGNAVFQNAPRYTYVPVVQKTVATVTVYVANVSTNSSI
ncbi:hypothetical protein LguiB_011935 [Lonicera macranthoides]